MENSSNEEMKSPENVASPVTIDPSLYGNNDQDVASFHRVESEVLTVNGNHSGTNTESSYQVSPEQMQELSAKLTEEARVFKNEYKTFKDAFFSQLDDDVSTKWSINLSIGLRRA